MLAGAVVVLDALAARGYRFLPVWEDVDAPDSSIRSDVGPYPSSGSGLAFAYAGTVPAAPASVAGPGRSARTGRRRASHGGRERATGDLRIVTVGSGQRIRARARRWRRAGYFVSDYPNCDSGSRAGRRQLRPGPPTQQVLRPADRGHPRGGHGCMGERNRWRWVA